MQAGRLVGRERDTAKAVTRNIKNERETEKERGYEKEKKDSEIEKKFIPEREKLGKEKQ